MIQERQTLNTNVFSNPETPIGNNGLRFTPDAINKKKKKTFGSTLRISNKVKSGKAKKSKGIDFSKAKNLFKNLK